MDQNTIYNDDMTTTMTQTIIQQTIQILLRRYDHDYGINNHSTNYTIKVQFIQVYLRCINVVGSRQNPENHFDMLIVHYKMQYFLATDI